MRARALVHVAGPERAGKTVFVEALIAERPRAQELVADVGRLRKEPALFGDILGTRGTRIPVTAVVVDLADPEDRNRTKAFARVRRTIASSLAAAASGIESSSRPGG